MGPWKEDMHAGKKITYICINVMSWQTPERLLTHKCMWKLRGQRKRLRRGRSASGQRSRNACAGM